MFKKVYLEIGNICNLHCHFCSLDNRKKEFMSVSDFKKISSEVKKFTDYIYLHVKGEPLIHPYLEEILDICKEDNLQVNITTNGTKLAEKLDIIKNKSCIRQVNISAHALSEISFNERKDYLNSLLNLIEYAFQTKAIYVSIRLWIKNEEINNLVLNFLNEKLNLNKEITLETKKIMDNVYLSIDEEFVWPSLENDFVSDRGRCYGAINQIAILASGDVVPCCLDSGGVMVLGNCLKQSLEEILNQKRYKEMYDGFKKGIVKEELCKHCLYRTRFK